MKKMKAVLYDVLGMFFISVAVFTPPMLIGVFIVSEQVMFAYFVLAVSVVVACFWFYVWVKN